MSGSTVHTPSYALHSCLLCVAVWLCGCVCVFLTSLMLHLSCLYLTHASPPCSFVEVRDTSLVWNYKHADVEFGRLQARDLLQVRHAASAATGMGWLALALRFSGCCTALHFV